MDSSWYDYLHWSFSGSHVLFRAIQLDSFGNLVAASLLTVGICLTERLVTCASEKKWCPAFFGQSRFRFALWRASLYWLVTTLRLMYMLIAMSFHLGLIVIAITTLALGQFIIEYQNNPHYEPLQNLKESYSLDEPFLSASSPEPTTTVHTRARSKPDHIFIHPNQSNLARADAAAYQLGIGGNTDFVQNHMYPTESVAWEAGKGREGARALLGNTRRKPSYQVGSDSDSDA